jgi:O-antigen/teichoic acid export membrane protein
LATAFHHTRTAVMQALGKANFLFKFNIITSIIKLSLIFGLTFIPWISYNSLIIALLINTFITTLVIYFYLKNTFKFKYHSYEIINTLIITCLTYFSLKILKAGINSYLLNTIFLVVLFYIYSKILKITRLHDK